MVEPRDQVLWFGETVSEAVVAEFERRRLRVSQAPVDDVNPAAARAAVFQFSKTVDAKLAAAASRLASSLVNNGLRVDLVAPNDAALGDVQRLVGDITGIVGIQARTAPHAWELAEAAARHLPGPRPRAALEIEVAEEGEPIAPDDMPLFQRAFSHCSKIVLVELTAGMSDARVFAVHMTSDQSNAGVWPQPAFAKLDRIDKITQEFRNYREYAETFIPFGLRPNVQDLVRGSRRALLVGNFVDRAESLWDLARRNVAAHAVSALVDETLGGWRDQAYAGDPIQGSVAKTLRDAGVWDPSKIRERYSEKARQHGLSSPDDLWDALTQLQQQYRLAPMHGDLHGENVMVRNGQAILIDLASVGRGPLTCDLAALETWMAFQLPDEADEKRHGDAEWLAQIERLYAPSAFLHPPGPCEPTAKYCWMATIVRQIRHLGIAAQSCATEYQSAVAVQLLRRCQWDDGPTADRYRREIGYRVASDLVGHMSQGRAAA